MKIEARKLVTGDCVKLPRLGWKRIERMNGATWLYVAFVFNDGKLRTFRPEQLIDAVLATDTPKPQPGEILRYDRETGRTSVVSPSFHGFSMEIGASFQALRGCRVGEFTDSAALAEVKRGARLFTEKAIYFQKQEKHHV